MSEVVRRITQAAFNNRHLTDAAVYTPPVGSPVIIRVFVHESAETFDTGDRTALITEEVTIDVVGIQPTSGGEIVIGSDLYTIVGEPRYDAAAGVYSCTCVS